MRKLRNTFKGLEENPLRNVGSAAAELAEIRRRFGINVARLITEGTES